MYRINVIRAYVLIGFLFVQIVLTAILFFFIFGKIYAFGTHHIDIFADKVFTVTWQNRINQAIHSCQLQEVIQQIFVR